MSKINTNIESYLKNDNNNNSSSSSQNSKKDGRKGKYGRLKELMNDDKLGSADRGWLKQEFNNIKRKDKTHTRVPPGKVLAHRRGFEADKGYSYEYSDLQNIDLHKIQHKYDKNGKLNKDRGQNQY